MAGLKTNIKTGDNVVVIAGKDKGKTGVIKSVDTKNERVIVEGVNMVKKHQKATPLAEAAMVEKEASLHASNVMIADPETGKPTKVGTKVEDGKKVRFAKASGKAL
ncbi:MAG TPA: 50S ribosomal protein L24 [Alphaproteobacteria bacterium]|nr:50S ribosomal protein L24 [Alphaproteobacteria bacterium]